MGALRLLIFGGFGVLRNTVWPDLALVVLGSTLLWVKTASNRRIQYMDIASERASEAGSVEQAN